MLQPDKEVDKKDLIAFVEYFFELFTLILIFFIEFGLDNFSEKFPVLKLQSAYASFERNSILIKDISIKKNKFFNIRLIDS